MLTTADFTARARDRALASLRRRMPLGARPLFRYSGDAGSATRGADARDAVDNVVTGVATTRTAARSRRKLRGIARLHGKWENRSERSRRAQESADESDGDQRLRVWDPFVQSVPAYLVTFAGVVAILEAAGMKTALSPFDSTLGAFYLPMALAAGGILVLAGHVMGDLLESSIRHRELRKALLAAGIGIFVLGVFAIAFMGTGRDANLRSQNDTGDASQLRARASRAERKAENLLQPLPTTKRGKLVEPSASDRAQAQRFQREAKALNDQADVLDHSARKERTLLFFIAVQALGLGVGTAGGFMFAAAAARRLARAARRWDARARRALAKAWDRRARVVRIAVEEHGYALAAGGNYGVQRGTEGTDAAPVTPTFDPERVVDKLVANRLGKQLPEIATVRASDAGAPVVNGTGSPDHIGPVVRG